MAIPPGLSPGANARALAASNAPGGGFDFGNLAVQLGLQPSPAHYTAQGVIEGQVGAGGLTAEQAARLKGRDITERGFNPILGFAGAIPYQLFDEAFDPESAGQRSLSDALSQGWQGMLGVADVVGERIQENPRRALSSIFSSQVTPEAQGIEPGKDITPREFFGIFPSKYHMPGYLGSTGPEPDTTGDPRVWYTEPVLGAGTVHTFPPGGRGGPIIDLDAPPDDRLKTAQDQLDKEKRDRLRLVKNGGGRGYRVPVNPPGSGIGSIALALAPLGYKLGQWLTSPLDEVSPYPEGPDYIGGQRAEDAARTGRRGYLEGIFPGGTPETLLPEQPSPYGSLVPISHTGAGIGGDNISETVDVMPVISPRTDFRSNMRVYDPPAVAFSRATPQIFYTDSGPMPTQEQIDISVENLGRLHREAQQAGPMESQVSQALSDYAFGRDVQPELQAIAELSEVDPTFNFEKYLDPTSQEIMDITSQVDSFSDIRDRAAEDQRQRDREQDQREERLEKAADDRRKSEQQARVEAKASAAAKRAETRKIASENKARKAEEKRIASKQASEEKQRRAVEKQMADMLKQAEETRQAYLERKRQEEDRRRRAGFGVGAMWT